MQFESLIFDIDGTLWDSRALVAEGYNIQLRAEGLERYCTDAEKLKPLFGKTTQYIADVMFPDLPEKERYALIARCMAAENVYLAQNECKIGYPKVKETMEQLAKKHRLFIVSNSEKGYPQLCVEKMGLQDLIEGHLCLGDTGTCKGETIKRLCSKHNITSACYIGDIQGDLEAAEYAGMPFIHCAFGFGQVERCWARIEAFEDLLTL